jgi:hypothetical protein
VPDEEWISQYGAAEALGISLRRVVWRIMGDHLDAAQNSEGVAGVTRTSVERDRQWTADASLGAKLRRFLTDLLKVF